MCVKDTLSVIYAILLFRCLRTDFRCWKMNMLLRIYAHSLYIMKTILARNVFNISPILS